MRQIQNSENKNCTISEFYSNFSSDEYPLELAEIERLAQREYEGRTLYSSSGSSGSSSSRSSSRSYQKPRKLTFIEQVNKRKACENLVRFIRLIDFMMRYTAHMIVCNSLIAVHKSLTSRAKSRPTPGELTSTDKEASGSVESDTEIPVFSCKVLLNAQIITISPNLDKFDEGFRILLTKLDEAVQSVPVLFQDVIFNPYTQPILYGKMENYKVHNVWKSLKKSQFLNIAKRNVGNFEAFLTMCCWRTEPPMHWAIDVLARQTTALRYLLYWPVHSLRCVNETFLVIFNHCQNRLKVRIFLSFMATKRVAKGSWCK